ncbi:hypothetical protein Tco_0048031, partial [Tanacetum coccineum]
MAPRGRPTRLNTGTTPPPVADPTTTTSVTEAQLQAMVDEGVTAALAAQMWNLKVQGTDNVVAYNQRFQELALLCNRMFPEETNKIE